MFAGQAAATFRATPSVHLEAAAQARVALAMAERGRIPASRQPAERATLLLKNVECPQSRLSTAAVLARAAALTGTRVEAARSLEALLSEASQMGLVSNELEIRLALGEVEMKSGENGKRPGAARHSTDRGRREGIRINRAESGSGAVKTG